MEYKLKPNFNEIKECINSIIKRTHFNVLKTIYAFANSKGGDLYVGIGDELTIEGIDNYDKKIVKGILKRTDKKVKIEQKIIKLKNSRVVMKIKVDPLKIYDKPLFLGGILYVRENKTTIAKKSFEEYLSLYKNRQLYMCFTKGIKSNLNQLKEQREPFELNQFIEGLKFHIKSLIEKNKITEYEKKLKEMENLLDRIKQKFVDLGDIPQGSSKAPFPDFNSLVDKFIDLYRAIISEV